MDQTESKPPTPSSGLPSPAQLAQPPQAPTSSRANPFSIDYILNSTQVGTKRQRTSSEHDQETLVSQLNLMSKHRAERLMLAAAAAAAAAAEANEMQSAAMRNVAQQQHQVAPLALLPPQQAAPPQLPPSSQPQLHMQARAQGQLDKFASQAQGQPSFLYLMACMLLQQQRQTAAANQQRQQQQQMAAAQMLIGPVVPNTMDSLALLARLTSSTQGAFCAEPIGAAAQQQQHQAIRSRQQQQFFSTSPISGGGQHSAQANSFMGALPVRSTRPPPACVQQGGSPAADLLARNQVRGKFFPAPAAVGVSQQQQPLPPPQQPQLCQIDESGEKLNNMKPAHSYIGLIGMCILSTPEKRMVLNDIYQHILDHYPYYRNRGTGWRNSVRHNLSLNECFQKAGRAANGKGHYWTIHPANMDDFMSGDFRRRRAQRKVRRWNNMDVPSDDSEDESNEDAARPPLPEHFKRALEMHRRLELGGYQQHHKATAVDYVNAAAVAAAAAAASSGAQQDSSPPPLLPYGGSCSPSSFGGQ